MDVAALGPNSIRLKGKGASVVVNPSKTSPKTEAEIVLFLNDYPEKSWDKVEGKRIVINGPGEYEVGGLKISGTIIDGNMVALLDVDNVKVLLGEGGAMEKIQDKIENCNVVVVGANNKFNYGFLPGLEPNVILVYGQLQGEVGKSLGKDSAEKVSKFSTSVDKLPEDLQVMLLG